MVEFFRLPVPVLKKLKICSFHVVVVQRRQRNVQNKRDARAGLLFCLLILLLFDVAVAVAVAVLVGTLRSDDGDGRENVAEKVNSCSFNLHPNYSKSLTLSNVGEPSKS